MSVLKFFLSLLVFSPPILMLSTVTYSVMVVDLTIRVDHFCSRYFEFYFRCINAPKLLCCFDQFINFFLLECPLKLI